MQEYQKIADELVVVAASLPETTTREKTTVYSGNGLRIRCVPTRENVERIAAKYRKGPRKSRTTRTTVSASSAKGAARNFCRDGEYHNAANITDCVFGRSASGPIPLVDVVEFEPGVVVGRMYYRGELTDWNVTQLLSGMTCGCASGTKAGAVARFDKVRDRVAEHTCDDYQSHARKYYGVDQGAQP